MSDWELGGLAHIIHVKVKKLDMFMVRLPEKFHEAFRTELRQQILDLTEEVIQRHKDAKMPAGFLS